MRRAFRKPVGFSPTHALLNIDAQRIEKVRRSIASATWGPITWAVVSQSRRPEISASEFVSKDIVIAANPANALLSSNRFWLGYP